MARIFVVGLAFGRLSLRVEEGSDVRVCITELQPDQWQTLWESQATTGSHILIEEFIQKLHGGNNSSASSSGISSSARGDDGSREGKSSSIGGGPPQRDQQEGGSNFDGGSGAGSGVPSSQPSFTSIDNTGARKLQITVVMGCTPGHGLVEGQALTLPIQEEGQCSIEAKVEFTFSDILQPPSLAQHTQRFVDLGIASSFNLIGHTLVFEDVTQVGEQENVEAEKRLKIGILHDELMTRYWCTSSAQALALLSFEASSESNIDVTEKTSGSKTRGWAAGGQLGHPGGGATVSANYTSMSLATMEHTTSSTIHGAGGTSFMVRDASCRSQNNPDVLAFVAEHHPYLRTMKRLRDVGLSCTPGVLIASSLGRRATVHFDGKFLLFGSMVETHKIEFTRLLGEFACTEKKMQWVRKLAKKEIKMDSTLICEKQAYCVTFCINHGFSLDTFAGGRLYWFLSQMAFSPIREVIPQVEVE